MPPAIGDASFLPAATLWLLRHGRTASNAARVLQTADAPLDDTGRAQARALGRRLAGAGLRGLVASSLPRARQTAQAIAAACRLPLLSSELLHERNFGSLRGRPWAELGFDPLAAPEAPPGGESAADFAARCAAAWAWLLAQQAQAGGALAVVTHGLVIREWLLRGPAVAPRGDAAPLLLANASVTVVEALPPHRVLRLNCTRHLDGGADTASGAA